MSIENIQKKRFLDTIYKIYYSLGSEPSLQEVSTLYGRYFSRFRPGSPIPVPYSDIQASARIDIEKMNRIFAHTGFNIDVLYEDYFDEIEQMYDMISAFKFRIDNLKARRAELEKTVDDKLFAISNTNGFYYAFTEAFNNTNNTDLAKTSIVIDTRARKATLPKESSGLFNYVGNVLNKVADAEMQLYMDGELQVNTKNIDISSVFDGLNNTEWAYKHNSSKIGVCTVKITIPVAVFNSETNGISVVEGKLNSQKPVEVSLRVLDSTDSSNSLFFNKNSSSDYDNFSFNFTTKRASTIELFLTKIEPDYVTEVNGQSSYVYDFRIDELIITAPYYSQSGIYISNPIGLPTGQNPNLAIDQIMLDAQEQLPSGTSIRYYIARDDGTPRDSSQFSWISISPYSMKDPLSSSVVKFDGTELIESTLVKPSGSSIDSTFGSMVIIPRTVEYSNPIKNYFYQNDETSRDFSLYRLARFPKGSDPYETYILESVDKNQLQASYVTGSSLDREAWQQVISGIRTDIVTNTTYYTIDGSQETFRAQTVPYGSIYLKVNIFMEENFTITKNFLKSLSAQYWDVSVYLNGVEISSNASLAPGILSSSLTWNFNRGQNTIVIIINKSTNDTSGVGTPFNGSISLMEGLSLVDIPSSRLYRNYLSYAKIEDLRNKYSNTDNVFSIIDWENNREIVYKRTEEIRDGSRVYYYVNTGNRPRYVRIRADFNRGPDAYVSPAIVSYTLKFKH